VFVNIKLKGEAIKKAAFYAIALGAALILTASTASVRAEDRDCTVDLKSMCAGIAPVTVYVLLGLERGMKSARFSDLASQFRQPPTGKAFGFIDAKSVEKYEDNWEILR